MKRLVAAVLCLMPSAAEAEQLFCLFPLGADPQNAILYEATSFDDPTGMMSGAFGGQRVRVFKGDPMLDFLSIGADGESILTSVRIEGEPPYRAAMAMNLIRADATGPSAVEGTCAPPGKPLTKKKGAP